MKELSIEEKAKAYDKVLEAVKSLQEVNPSDEGIQNWVNENFPELKESEDEKIRKELVQFFEEKDEEDFEEWIPKAKVLAWFEKQGEHAKFRDSIQVGDKLTLNEDGVLVNLTQLKRVAKKDEKQGEKPRYSIGDVLCDKSCTTLNKDAQPNFEIVYIKNGLYICDKGYIPISQQDEYELVAKKIEQKPAWSEEDEKMIEAALQFAHEYGRHGLWCWLKSLKDRVQPQPKQEWSVEDNERIEQICEDLKCGLINFKSGRTVKGLHFEEIIESNIDWLKSLRPQSTWKPSDKQMITLRQVISGCSYDIEPLVEMEEQLKKLMEE